MIRNLDLTALRSFVAVAEMGGVTKAAHQLSLTQSAVSMQLKRLEEFMGVDLMDRSARSISLTPQGELLLGYAKRMLNLNDEAWNRLTANDYEGEVIFGVPHDIVFPHVPRVLKKFAQEYPRVRVQLLSSFTRDLQKKLSNGEADLILSTEQTCSEGAEVIQKTRLIWFSGEDSRIVEERPLPLVYEESCLFRPLATAALDNADIPWRMVVNTESARTVSASVVADLGLHACLKGTQAHEWCEVPESAGLPVLPEISITMSKSQAAQNPLIDRLAQLVREAYALGEVSDRNAMLRAV